MQNNPMFGWSPYGPTSYPIPQFPQPGNLPQFFQQPQQPETGTNWCQGIEGAKGFAVAPGKSALILDSEAPVFYLKSVDASGIPAPLRVFDYAERQATPPVPAAPAPPAFNPADYISRKEFESWTAQFSPKLEGGM